MIYYAAGITLAFLVAIQQLLNKRRKEGQSHA
jgi:hypothetical protein